MGKYKMKPTPKTDPYKGLNESQKKVVAFKSGRLVVPATAGSGKTKCVVHRIARLVQDGVDPDYILATTFSKKGAEEMNTRLESLGVQIGGRKGQSGARVGTFHSLCYDILKDGSPYEHYRFDERSELRKILKQDILGFKKMDWKDADLTLVLAYIGHCKNELIAPVDSRHPDNRRYDEAYIQYEKERHRRELYTFDCMLYHSCEYLLEDEQARARWSFKYRHVIIDESQDTNKAQWVLAEILTGHAESWLTVGDDDQAIFTFRGAHPENLINFPQDYNADVVTVDTNYRSRPEIVEMANRVITNNQKRIVKIPIAHREPGGEGTIDFSLVTDMDSEAEHIYSSIMDMRAFGIPQKKGLKWKDFVILYRTNAQSRAFEEVFIREKVPYVIVGGIDFWRRKEIKDLLGYLRVAAFHDDAACRIVVNRPFRYIGRVTIEKIADLAEERSLSFFETLDSHSIELGLKHNQVGSLQHFASIVKKASLMLRESAPISDILNMVILGTDYMRWIQKDMGSDTSENSRVSNIRELLRTVNRFSDVEELFGYLRNLEAEKRRRKSGKADVVQLMTIHKAKGLQFPVVFLAGACENILPHARTQNLEEERRLFFVAATRAMDRLFITAPVKAYIGSQLTDMQVSRFVKEAGLIPEKEPR